MGPTFKNLENLHSHPKYVSLFSSWWIFCTGHSCGLTTPLWMKCSPRLCNLSHSLYPVRTGVSPAHTDVFFIVEEYFSANMPLWKIKGRFGGMMEESILLVKMKFIPMHLVWKSPVWASDRFRIAAGYEQPTWSL